MTTMEKLTNDINKAMETSCICRGEWCRSLEPEVDELEYQLTSVCSFEGTCSSDKVVDLENKIRMTYKHIPSDTLIC
ncbi:MAG: hypothetical protein JRJ14_08945 [Deltaproteobacteria bacterium]|jgi:hypothetical protein|nr:hypothetical protein [Deltaproteobacteria bacterium]